jgi:hypothetical protein
MYIIGGLIEEGMGQDTQVEFGVKLGPATDAAIGFR